MDRNTIIGLVLIVLIMIGYSIYQMPSKQQLAKQKHYQDSITLIQIKQDSIAKLGIHNTTSKKNDTSATNAVPTVTPAALDTSVFSNSTTETKQNFTTVETDKMKVTFTNKGGKIYSVEIKNYQTWDKKPLILFTNKNDSSFGYQFFAGNKMTNTAHIYFTCDKSNSQITGSQTETITFRSYAGNSKRYIEQKYQLSGNSYELNYSFSLVNMDSLVSSNRDIILYWNEALNKQEENADNERRYSTVYYKLVGDDADDLSTHNNDSKNLSLKVEWVSFKQLFFNSTLICPAGFDDASISVRNDTVNNTLKSMHSYMDLTYNAQPVQTYSMQWYFGPSSYDGLKKLNIGLEQIIPLGYGIFSWFTVPVNKWIIIPTFQFLSKFIKSYGIIILILTILLRIILLPFTYRSFLSGAKMRVLKPEIDELKEKYKNDQAKFSQEQMKLTQKAGVSPLGGCLPMLLQLPILYAMFVFFPSCIELRQQSFLWIKDLSSYDSIYNFSTSIPFYGNHVSLLTLLMLGSQILMTWYNSQFAVGMNNQMKWMQYVFPFILLGVFNSLSAALVYYYFLSNIISFIIMVVMQEYIIDHAAIHAKIQENKKKAPKKGGWIERLEKMQREQQRKSKQ